MSKLKVWTLPELLDRIWMLSRGKRTAVATGDAKTVYRPQPKAGEAIPLDEHGNPLPPRKPFLEAITKRVVTGWDEDYKPRTYELNKISAASAAALYERIKTMRAKAASQEYEKGFADGQAKGFGDGWDLRGRGQLLSEQMMAYKSPPPDLAPQLPAVFCNCPSLEQLAAQGYPPSEGWHVIGCPIHGSGGI